MPAVHLLPVKSNLRNTLGAQNTRKIFGIVLKCTVIRVESTTVSQLSNFGKLIFSAVVINRLFRNSQSLKECLPNTDLQTKSNNKSLFFISFPSK